MGIFEYLGVLISVIMGLGVTHLAVGVSKLVQNRDRCKPSLIHSLWTGMMLLYIVVVWWGMYWWSNHTDWLNYEYLFIMAYALVLFFLSALLYPYDMDKDIDAEAYFFKQRRWFFSFLIVAFLLDIPETLLKSEGGLRELPRDYFVFIAVQLAIATTGLITKNRKVHIVLPIAALLAIFAITRQTTMSVIAN